MRTFQFHKREKKVRLIIYFGMRFDSYDGSAKMLIFTHVLNSGEYVSDEDDFRALSSSPIRHDEDRSVMDESMLLTSTSHHHRKPIMNTCPYLITCTLCFISLTNGKLTIYLVNKR